MLSAFVRILGCVAIWRRIAESGVARLPSRLVESVGAATRDFVVSTVSRRIVDARAPAAESRTAALGALELDVDFDSPHAASRLNAVPAIQRRFGIASHECNGRTVTS